jgi:uncharacterized membrane protein
MYEDRYQSTLTKEEFANVLQILGDALIAVVFVRNGLAMVIRFSFTDWVYGMGIQNTFILIGVIALVTAILPALLMIYGKRARVKTASKYKHFASRQQVARHS